MPRLPLHYTFWWYSMINNNAIRDLARKETAAQLRNAGNARSQMVPSREIRFPRQQK